MRMDLPRPSGFLVWTVAILVVMVLPASPGNAQMSAGGTPLKSLSGTDNFEWLEMEAIQVDELLLEDQWLALTGKKNQRFAKEIQVSIHPDQHGTWEEYPDGALVWRIGLRGKGARALGIEFSRYMLEPGVRIFLFDPELEHILGAYTDRNNRPFGSLPVSFLSGDELIVQMEVPSQCDTYGELTIGFARWAYLPVPGGKSESDNYYGKSGLCNLDINCDLGMDWQLHKNSVVRIITAEEKCTGVLVNNTRQDLTPYVYTAAHCVYQNNKYQNPIFYFLYESPYCGGPDGSTVSISGATVVATGDTLENPRDADSLDFVLLKLNVAPTVSYRPYYAGWNRSTTPAQHTVTIHHPSGDVKKISIDTDPPSISYHDANYFPDLKRNSHWRILQWDVATTEFGSSGCPLFDQDHLLLGTLTGGQATCAYPYNDYFTRFDLAWDYYPEPTKQLKHWLDPDNTGATSLGGLAGWPVAVEPLRGSGDLKLYPNPASSALNLEGQGDWLRAGREAVILVFDATGKLCMQERLTWEGTTHLGIAGLPVGLYVLRLSQGSSEVSRRFVVSR